ncbi:MAG: SDR family oxidoreductase [Ignavibacteria bacterium]|nr:SDR family oxidoreductase [Ignavibacteria bacterium]MBK9228760.1 SDR family oxidoreductase [Ignavibacteria bacterium]
MSKKKVLVTGGAGFIGSNLVKELLARGYAVKVLDNFSSGKRDNLKPFGKDIELIEGDIRSYHIVREAVKDTEVVFHQAALPSVPRSIKDPITSNEVNVNGTLNVLDASVSASVRRVIYASSSSVYGDNPELPKHEGMLPNPLSPYAVSKLAGEKYCSVFSRIYGLETIALRYFNVFGPNQDPTSQYSAVIPKFIRAIAVNEEPIIYGDGEQSRDFTYVSNVVDANILASSSPCDSAIAINCACSGQITLNELVGHINKLLGKNVKPKYADPRTGDIKHSFADIRMAKEKINFVPSVDFEKGLELTVNSYLK